MLIISSLPMVLQLLAKMPVIPSLFGGSCRDDLISFSSLNTWDALDGLFPALRRGPAKEMRMRPPYSYGSRIRCHETAGRHAYKADLRGLGMDDEKLKAEEAGVLRARSEQRSGNGKEQRPSRRGETSPGGFRRRILLPYDAEVEEMLAAISKGVLMISTPRKGMVKKDYESSNDQKWPPKLPATQFRRKNVASSILLSSFDNRSSSVFDPFSALDVWDTFRGFPFNGPLWPERPSWDSDTTAFTNTRVDWKETPEAHIFKADLPGVKEEVKVEVEEGRILQISGQRTKEEEEVSDTWYRVERSSGSFLRRFRLPEDAMVDQVRASMENGGLTVTVPKQEVKKPEVKAIDIS
ncbi:hypothetical protein Taro_035904, partial [Colocasia esculenta]|nr:hypothetical protein [Colocasia esculenta]